MYNKNIECSKLAVSYSGTLYLVVTASSRNRVEALNSVSGEWWYSTNSELIIRCYFFAVDRHVSMIVFA